MRMQSPDCPVTTSFTPTAWQNGLENNDNEESVRVEPCPVRFAAWSSRSSGAKRKQRHQKQPLEAVELCFALCLALLLSGKSKKAQPAMQSANMPMCHVDALQTVVCIQIKFSIPTTTNPHASASYALCSTAPWPVSAGSLPPAQSVVDCLTEQC